MAAGTTYNVGTLPAEYYPTYNISQRMDVGSGQLWLFITTSGDVKVQPLTAISKTQAVNLNFSYI